jgi:chromosome segregation ATPase
MIDLNKETLELINYRIAELEGRISMWKGMIANHQDDIDRLQAAVDIDKNQIRKLEEERMKILGEKKDEAGNTVIDLNNVDPRSMPTGASFLAGEGDGNESD